MLRKIAGWVRYDGEEWETTMRRMNNRVQQSLRQFHIRPWSERIVCARKKYNYRLLNLPKDRWEKLSLQWEPKNVQDDSQEHFAYRLAGRPLLRWTDTIPTTLLNEAPNLCSAPVIINETRNRVDVPFPSFPPIRGGKFVLCLIR